jgi:hypothetical protein
MKTKFLLGLAVVFLAMQAFRPAKNLSTAAPFAGKDEVTVLFPASPEVKQILATSCYDCHSNHTRYPWYAEIQPVGWWLASHVNDGRKHLNFSEFGTYPAKRQLKKLEEINDEVQDHGMPLKSYTLVHVDARLTPAQATALCDWAEAAHDRVAGK